MTAADAGIVGMTLRLGLLLSAVVVQLRFHCTAIPRRGNEPWSVILCKFADIHYEPRAREWFIEWMIGSNGPGESNFYVYSSIFSIIQNKMSVAKIEEQIRSSDLKHRLKDNRVEKV